MEQGGDKGQILSGEFGNILVRQKSDSPIELGELLVAQTAQAKIILQAYDLTYGSQIAQQQLELLSGMQLEQSAPIQFFEPQLRNYMMARLKTVLTITKGAAALSKSLPPFFSTVRQVTADDMSFLSTKGFAVGNLRSGSKTLPVPIFLDTKQVLSHHILIPATTGKGKSNLMHVISWNLLGNPDAALLLFDPHDEYYGRNGNGLKDHPLWSRHGVYYSQKPPVGAFSLVINVSLLKPWHFSAVADFSGPQQELIQVFHNAYDDQWIEAILTNKPIQFKFEEGTFNVVKRRICRLLDIRLTQTGIMSEGIYTTGKEGESTIKNIVSAIMKGTTVVVDTSSLSGQTELLLNSIITTSIYDQYRLARANGTIDALPVVSVVLEEAPRVLGKDVLERGQNIFSTIAKEGRKFKVGLCAITQLPSLIPKDILANINTKIILGIEMAPERTAVIESAAQDLSSDSRAIASLDKGEAIITSNFTRFAIPISIPLFSSIIAQSKIDHGIKSVKLPGL
ncbi:MAG TPA: ATP-binding protein [Acidobacteriota bacterium]|nr:ATP-binding protein [Acidobacteriota bacterium]